MAIPKIKATYSLDVETASTLERLAERWKTSKSEALRRLIMQGDAQVDDAQRDKIAALERLQKSIALTKTGASKWIGEVRAERIASTQTRSRTKT
ncbi:MAG: ribbon-helix-helix protein, CopG family [Gemmatimonadaceae bacterium]